MMAFPNGLRVSLGPLVGIDNDFNQIVGKIDQNTTPLWQQQQQVYEAVAFDLQNSTLSSSSFYDTNRLNAIMGRAVEATGNTFAPGLNDQLGLSRMFDPAVQNSLDFLNVPINSFNAVMNDPNYGQNFTAPLQIQQDPTGGLAYPVLPETGVQDLEIMTLTRMANFYTAPPPQGQVQPFHVQAQSSGGQVFAQNPQAFVGIGVTPFQQSIPYTMIHPQQQFQPPATGPYPNQFLYNPAAAHVAVGLDRGISPYSQLDTTAYFFQNMHHQQALRNGTPVQQLGQTAHPAQHPQPIHPINRGNLQTNLFGGLPTSQFAIPNATQPGSPLIPGPNSIGGLPPFTPGTITVATNRYEVVNGVTSQGLPFTTLNNPIIASDFSPTAMNRKRV
jgi:hypothetical protein